MKIFNKLTAAVMALPLLAGLTACSDEHADYTPAATLANEQVYFPTGQAQNVALASDATSFDVELARVKTAGELTVNLVTTQSEESSTQIAVPASVTFNDGDSIATITVTYDPTTIEYDDVNEVTISIADSAYTTPYGSSKYQFNVSIPAPWISLGKGKFMDAFIYDDETWFDVEVQYNAVDPLAFRLVHPYDEMLKAGEYTDDYYKQGPSEYFEFYILPKGYTLMDVEATQNDYVYWNDVRTGYHNPNYDDGEATDGEVYAMFPGRFTSLRSEAAWQYNKVVDYQASGLPGEVEMAPYYYIFGVGGWNYTQNEGTIRILFPGYELSDYSAVVAYAGVLKTPEEQNEAVVDITLGVDVATAKYALTDASIAENAASEAIASSDLDATEITAGGRVYIPLTEDGKYRVTIVTFDAEGGLRESASAVFEFAAAGSVWESLGMAEYTDDFMTMGYYDDDDNWVSLYNGLTPQTYEVEVLAHTKTPGLYRLKNAYAEVYPFNEPGDWDDSMDYYLEIDATDPTAVLINKQELGLDWGYGMISAESDGAYYLAHYDLTPAQITQALGVDVFGKLIDGIITFPEDVFTVSFGSNELYGNHNGAFKVVLPEARTGAVKASKAPARKVSRRANFTTAKRSHLILKSGKVANKDNNVVRGRISKAVK